MRQSSSPTDSTKVISCPLPIGKPAARKSRPSVSRLLVRRRAVTSSGARRLLLRCSTGRPLDQLFGLIATHAFDIFLVLEDDAQRVVDRLGIQLSRAEG